jgi:hypothetical protein
MTNHLTEEILISIDAEFTGPIPGRNSMISFGATAHQGDGKELSSFKVNICELPGSTRDADTMHWWSKFPEAWTQATEYPIDPELAMQNFDSWIKELDGTPKLMGWPYSADFLFVYWYYVMFLDCIPPFGFDGIDIKSYALAKLGLRNLSDVSRSLVREKLGIPDTPYSHDPLDDARDQAALYFGLRALR